MKKLFLFIGYVFICKLSIAQNVGIGITSPTAKLHINGDVKVQGTNLFEFGAGVAGKEVNAGKIGYNAFGQNALTIIGAGTTGLNRAVYFYAEGGVSMNGQLNMIGIDGVSLSASDNAMITRGFDLFMSGKHSGIGRWGLFLEPNRLTLGVPNLAGKGFEFVKYNATSTKSTVLSIESDDGALKRPAQTNVDLLPICVGSVDVFGNIRGGSGNFTVARNLGAGTTDITITGVTYTAANYAVIATCYSDNGVTAFAMALENAGKIRLNQYDDGGNSANQAFSFVVYQLN